MSTEPTAEPTAEQIVGEQNVIDVGSVEVPPPPLPQGYKCNGTGCSFSSTLLSEIEEHCNGTGHGSYVTDEIQPKQPELFRPPGSITRMLNIALPTEVIDDNLKRLAELFQRSIDVREEKKSADADFNARLKNLDEQMQGIARVLKTPFTYEAVNCEWRIIEGENARGLYRLDTGEQIDKQPLTEEDRAEELRKAEEANQVPVVTCGDPEVHALAKPGEECAFCEQTIPEEPKLEPQPEASEAAETGSFINNRNSGRKKRKSAPVE